MQETQETRLSSLGWEDTLEKEMTTHSSILAWEIPCAEDPLGGYSPDPGGSTDARVKHDLVTKTI